MITPSNDITRFFEQLGLKVKIHAPVRFSSKYSRHRIEYMPGGKLPLDRMAPLLAYYFGDDVREAAMFDELSVRLSDFKPEGHDITGICKKCGCTAQNACYDELTGTCWWVTEELCSACATPEERQASLVENNDFLKSEENSND